MMARRPVAAVVAERPPARSRRPRCDRRRPGQSALRHPRGDFLLADHRKPRDHLSGPLNSRPECADTSLRRPRHEPGPSRPVGRRVTNVLVEAVEHRVTSHSGRCRNDTPGLSTPNGAVPYPRGRSGHRLPLVAHAAGQCHQERKGDARPYRPRCPPDAVRGGRDVPGQPQDRDPLGQGRQDLRHPDPRRTPPLPGHRDHALPGAGRERPGAAQSLPPSGAAAVEAVTFDYWNTLCREPPGGYLRGRRLEAMSQVLVDAGVGSAGVVLPVLSGGYDGAWRNWDEAWRANRQFTGLDAAQAIADAVEAAFPGAGGAAGLRPRARGRLHRSGAGAEPALVDGVADALAAFSNARRPAGDHLRRRVHAVARPAPPSRAPRAARVLRPLVVLRRGRRLQARPPDLRARCWPASAGPTRRRCAHVGDRRRTDVAGAQAVGMRAVRITAVFEDEPDQGPAGDP